MAVAFSTGGSGYTRSDFMISDAAIPARVEEAAKADQKEQFSKVLSGIGSFRNASNASNASNTSGAGSANNAISGSDAASEKMAQNNAVSEKETPASYEKFEMLRSELTKSDGSLDLRKVVAAIADGKLTFADIPQEYITKALLAELINTVENVDNAKSDKDGDSEHNNDPAVQQVMTELAAMMNQTAIPDDISDLSDEIYALTIKITGADEVQAVQQNVQEQAVQTVQTQAAEQTQATGEAVEFTVKLETEQKSQAEAKPVQEVQPEAKQAAVTEAAVQTAENTGAQSEAQTDAGQSGQQDGAAQVQTAQAGQTEQAPQEDVKFRSDVRSVEVRTAEKPQEAPQQEQTQVFADHTAQRSRVVFKSDELEAIKSGGEKTGDAAQAQPQGIPAESPVEFTRQDGAEITVKPSEVAQQVSGKITERAADLKEGAVEYSITLDPEDLGRITVRMTKTADGAVSVSIAAENSKTMKIIEDNGSAIQDTLRQNGVQLENWQTVSESRQEPQAQDYQGSSKNPYRENENHRQDDDRDGESFAEIIASM
ncbi:MAG: flagellar hook-length control protein FliK [Eubacterium sp.]|nr:flagellar hook-length control protein FliK [Eubacterium sp.]